MDMKRLLLLAVLVVPFCMGQSCSSTALSALTGTSDQATDGSDSTNDGTGSSTDGTTTEPKGVPDGTYSGVQTIVYSLDKVTDAYPAQTQTSSATTSYTFADGLLLRADGTSINVGDVERFSSPFGDVAEQVTGISLSEKVTEYYTQPEMVVQDWDLSWNLVGQGTHTFRFTEEKVLYDGHLVMDCDVTAGAAYEATFEYSASLKE
jgi:hypothetical protein